MATLTLALPELATRPTPTTTTTRPRLAAVDALRGLAIVGMLLVNNPGDRATTPWALRHSAWDGLTPADLVFPLFLVAVGLSLPFSRRAAEPREVLRRFALLWLVGAALMTVKYGELRYGGGVLQQVGVAYVAGWLVLRAPRRLQLLGAAALLLVPLPAVAGGAHVVGGAFLGRRLHDRRALALAALATGALGVAAAVAVPVNKQLWTPSYALVTFALSAALLILAGHHPRLTALGRNPIAVYVVFHLLTYTVLETVRPQVVGELAPALGPVTAGVAYSLLVVAMAIAFARWLHRRGVVVRL